MSRVLLIFSKTGNVRFIGHLDLMKTFRRAVNRANLPVAYSAGFNPHQKLGFAAPLALGMEGYNEAAELELDGSGETAADIAGRLNAALPKGVFIHAARLMEPNEKSPAALVTASCYEMGAADACMLPEKVNELLARGPVIIQKHTKGGIKDADIRPDIISLEASGGSLRAVLASGGQRGLKPDLLAGAMGITFCRCARLNIYKTVNGALLPLYS